MHIKALKECQLCLFPTFCLQHTVLLPYQDDSYDELSKYKYTGKLQFQ